MRIQSYIYHLTVSVVLISCGHDDASLELPRPDTFSDDEYKVYASILAQHYSSHTHYYILQQTFRGYTSPGDGYQEIILDEFLDADDAIFTDLASANPAEFYLDDKVIVPNKETTLISSDEMSQLFANDCDNGWVKFFDKYTDAEGLFQFSRVGFNADKTQAAVEMGFLYGCLGADGLLLYLVKENNDWVVKKIVHVWAS